MNWPVVSVSGPPGSGKTTLCRAVVKAIRSERPDLDVQLVEYDRYENMTRQPPPQVEDWLARGAPYDEIPAPGLVEALAAAAARGPVLFDTPLGRAYSPTARFIVSAIWIECPLDVALSRKLQQLAAGVVPEQAVAFAGWISGYMQAYPQIVRPACIIQASRLREDADLLMDATAPNEELVEGLKAFATTAFSQVANRG